MLLKAGMMPINNLLAEGFDMVYIGRRHGLGENRLLTHILEMHCNAQERACLADAYAVLQIAWPYHKPNSPFGSGCILLPIVQANITLPQREGVVILGPQETLQHICLTKQVCNASTVAVLHMRYGTTLLQKQKAHILATSATVH